MTFLLFYEIMFHIFSDLPNCKFEDLRQAVVQHVRLRIYDQSEKSLVLLTQTFSFIIIFFYLRLAVSCDLLKRSFLELLHHLTPLLSLLLLQTGGV